MSSESIDTTSIRNDCAEIASTDDHIRAEANKLGAVIRELLDICAATVGRKVIHPTLEQDADGTAEKAPWAGIKFAGGREKSHTGQGHTTWQWSIGGQSAYITSQGRIHLIDWDGEATDFSGCKGYMDRFTSEVTTDELEEHLEANPQSAIEIVETLRKLAAEDKRARKTLAAEIAAVLGKLATA